MTVTRRGHRAKQTPVEIDCIQRENIAKLNLIIGGNGHPEEGLAFKVSEMYKNVTEIKKTVEELKTAKIEDRNERRIIVTQRINIITVIILVIGLIVTIWLGVRSDNQGAQNMKELNTLIKEKK